jgi:YgiT-type zinc finger domain-containing protein
MIDTRVCPTCGHETLKRIRRDWKGSFKGEPYEVPDLEYLECSRCGEKIYDRAAMRKIERCSPAFRDRFSGAERKTA